MIHDIHSHTYYSFCGRDDPHLTVDAAIAAGIECFGICDHNYGITRDGNPGQIDEYLEFLDRIKDEYKDRIKLVRGIEICTLDRHRLLDGADISHFDYCLIENLDSDESIIRPDERGESGIFEYAKFLGCPKVGIAHTNLFAFINRLGADPYEFCSRLAQSGVFWEMNMNYDSIHSYREHRYVKDFAASEYQQDIIRRSGLQIAVGFDGHKVEDYRPDRVIGMCRLLEEKDIPTAF